MRIASPLNAALPYLNDIGLARGTDKASNHHGLLRFYEQHLYTLRHESFTLLEIGAPPEPALRMWADYFPKARIVGLDVSDGGHDFIDGRITVEAAAVPDATVLDSIASRFGPFHVVVDDGRHLWTQQLTAMRVLLPHVAPGGFFILEDLDTSFGGYVQHFQGTETTRPADVLWRLSQYVAADVQLNPAEDDNEIVRSFAREVAFVSFAKRTSIIRRRGGV